MIHIVGDKNDPTRRFARMNSEQRFHYLFDMVLGSAAQSAKRISKLNQAVNSQMHLIGALVQTLEVQRQALLSRFGDGQGGDGAGLSTVELDVIRRANELADEAREALQIGRFVTDPETEEEKPMPAEQVAEARKRDSLSIRLLASVKSGSEPVAPDGERERRTVSYGTQLAEAQGAFDPPVGEEVEHAE